MKVRTRIFLTRSTMIAALTVPVVSAVTEAHHSRAGFSEDILEIEGEIAAVGWRNPHPMITVNPVDDAGLEKTWNCAVSD